MANRYSTSKRAPENGLFLAFRLMLRGDAEVWRITLLSLQVSGTATLLSLVLGVPVGTFLALMRFPGQRLLVSLINTWYRLSASASGAQLVGRRGTAHQSGPGPGAHTGSPPSRRAVWALDPPSRAALWLDLERILRETGITTVFVTHERHEVLTLGDRLVVVFGGTLVQLGTPWEVFTRPATEDIAHFVGADINLPGTVKAVQQGIVQVTPR